MTQGKKKAVGYTRVSTARQAQKGESLLTQETSIKQYAKSNGFELLEIYSDEGISGGTVKDRPRLKQLLASLDSIDCLIVPRLSRLGRNSRELLNNVHDVEKAGLEIVFIDDNIDLSTPQGRLLITILASVAQLEREITAETSVENKIARCKRDIPATGKIPWGRVYDKETNQWLVDEEKKALFQQITNEYVRGGSLREICKDIPERFQMSYSNYLKVIDRAAGDIWEVQFKKEENPIKINVPPLLTPEIIRKVEHMRRFNATSNRHDVKRKYLLTGFLRCGVCGKSLVGQTQSHSKYKYKYYQHTHNPGETCKAIKSIAGDSLEQAILSAIWENTFDEEGFNEALEERLPDKGDRIKLENRIDKITAALELTDKQLSKLADAVLEETLTKQTIKAKETELLKEKAVLNSSLEKDKSRLSRMADPVAIEKEAKEIRQVLLDQFGSIEHFMGMDFEEKRRLLHVIFNGEDEEGNKRGVYITKIGNHKYEYFVFATLFEGLRVMYKKDFDYYNPDDPDMPEYHFANKHKHSKHNVRLETYPKKSETANQSVFNSTVDINIRRRKKKFR